MNKLSFALFAGLALSACKDDNSTPSQSELKRFCERQCAKMAECDFLFGQTEAQCVTDCTKDDNSSQPSTCNPTVGEVDACLDALEDATCASLMNGTPAACDICPESSQPDAGTGQDATVLTDATTSGPVECQTLSACCPTLPAIAQPSCTTLVSAGNAANCTSGLENLQESGFCGGNPDAGDEPDSGDEPDAGEAPQDASTGLPDATSGDPCGDLTTCCGMLQAGPIKTACESVAGSGVEQACQSTLEGLAGSGC